MRPFGRSPGELSDALYSGMFPMLPFANCIRDNCFTFEGQRYEVASNMAGARLNFHGSGWQSPWRVASVSEAVAVLVLDEGRVDKVYCFSAVQRFGIDRAGLTVETTLTNRADLPAIFHLHGHHFRLLDRLDDGWKPFWLDTLAIDAGQTQRIAFAAENAGRWLMETMATDWAAPRLLRWYSVE